MRLTVLLVLLATCSLLLPGQEKKAKVKTVSAVPTSAASGKEMFNAYCASCHGVGGKGDGPAASALRQPPSDLTLLARKAGGKYPGLHVMSVIQGGTANAHGSKDMPVWGPILLSVSQDVPSTVAQRVSNLNGYIESLQVK